MAEAFLPPEIVQVFLPTINFGYATNQDYVTISISSEHELVLGTVQ
jgi:hypothetical protein